MVRHSECWASGRCGRPSTNNERVQRSTRVTHVTRRVEPSTSVVVSTQVGDLTRTLLAAHHDLPPRAPMHALLRVLFTINPSYQYIRAGSPGSVPVVPLPEAGHNASTSTNTSPPTSMRYGTVSLKPCMEAIRRSSPELVQNRDFTIYVLDPLEANSAPPMVQIPQHDNATPQASSALSGTVAVGYGLMSEALAAKDEESPQVVGTFTLTHGRESIEVVLTLREVSHSAVDAYVKLNASARA